jgi:osmotically-inducible protein OsmY
MSRKFSRSLVLVLALSVVSVPSAVWASASQTGAANKTQTAKPTDNDLKDRIEHRLETNAVVRKYDVKVAVNGGVATLTGDVATAAQKAEAATLAKGVSGVAKVENNITVNKDVDTTLAERSKSGLAKTGEAITDAWITTKVKWFFIGEDALKDSNIDVDTSNNVVTLKGTVKTAAGKARAVQLAKQTSGVKNVVDQLTIGK